MLLLLIVILIAAVLFYLFKTSGPPRTAVVMSICGNVDDVNYVKTLWDGELVVYDKCNQCDGLKDCTVLPNVGREQGTWVTYVLENYDNLPEHIIFLPAPVHKHDRIGRFIKIINGETLHGNIIGDHENFILEHWSGNDLVPADIRPFRKWFEHNIGTWDPSIRGVFDNGIMKTTGKSIRQKSKDFFENLSRQLSVDNNTEVAHFMERSMGAVF